MTITLAEAKVRVARLLDDAAGARFDATLDIERSLRTWQHEVMRHAVLQGAANLQATEQVTSSSAGVLDLTSLDPLTIISIAQVQGTRRLRVDPAQVRSVQYARAAVDTFEVVYVPRPAFPSSPSAAFLWGPDATSRPTYDEALCVAAAASLKPIEGEEVPGLVRLRDELFASIANDPDMPACEVAPMRLSRRGRLGGRSGLVWYLRAPDTVQIADA